jgi:hypothetical protein
MVTSWISRIPIRSTDSLEKPDLTLVEGAKAIEKPEKKRTPTTRRRRPATPRPKKGTVDSTDD